MRRALDTAAAIFATRSAKRIHSMAGETPPARQLNVHLVNIHNDWNRDI
jgi:hypothetical protein